MKSELIEHSPVRKELKIEIPAEQVQATHQRISQEYARFATVPGFRQGRAPLSLIRRRFKDEIASDTLRELVPDAFKAAVEEHGLKPLGDPDIHLENAEGLKELGVATVSLHAHIEVMPEVEVKEYKGLAVTRRVRPVPLEKIDALIAQMREEEASLDPVEERGAETGDTVTAAVTGRYTDGEDEDFDIEDMEIELGHENTLPEFTACLLGTREGDERNCTVKYAADYSSEQLAGREVEFMLAVDKVYRKRLPEVNDEWAQSLDEGYESADDLRAKLQAQEEEGTRKEADQRVRAEVVSKLIDAHEFEVPTALVVTQGERLVNNAYSDFARMGLDPSRLKKEFWQSYFQNSLPQAERDVRGALLLEKIADLENIEVTDEDVDAEIKAVAEYVGITEEEAGAELLKDNGETVIRSNLRTRKTIDVLVAHAEITEGEWVEPTPPGAPEETDDQPMAEADGAAPAAETDSSAEAPAEASGETAAADAA